MFLTDDLIRFGVGWLFEGSVLDLNILEFFVLYKDIWHAL